VPEGGNPIYIVAFLTDVDTDQPTPIAIGVDATGYVRIPLPAALRPTGSSLRSLAQTFQRPSVAAGDTLPPGAEGALLPGGGVWLHTPADWVLLVGILRVDTDSTDPQTFSLTGVCLPPPIATPSPTPVPAEPAATTPVGAPAPILPVTGVPTGLLAGAGLVVAVVGVGLVLAARRRRGDGNG
jgi:hypothetical protein